MAELEDAPLDDASYQPPSRGPRVLITLVVVALLIAGFGAIGHVSGTGWFSYRTILYEKGELYVLNMDDAPKFVVVDGLERVEVPAGNAQLVELVGGTSQVAVFDAKEQPLATHEVTVNGSDAILKLTEVKCLAIVDVAPYYRGDASADLSIVGKVKKTDKVHVLGTTSVIWPRKPFPKRIPGSGTSVWAELVGCELLDDEEFLKAYLDIRLHERVAKAMGKPQMRR